MFKRKELAAMVKKWKDVFLFAFAAGFIPVPFKCMPYDDPRIE
jgi:hypothetical protein